MTKKYLYGFIITTFNVLVATAAIAANDAWVQPATELLDVLEGGLVSIGAPIIGIGIIGLGLWSSLAGNMDWKRLGFVILGGILVMAGPAALRALLEATGS
jgi:type IV secretory pathway VirB2 component (pilin)